jgi:hypothetical protein
MQYHGVVYISDKCLLSPLLPSCPHTCSSDSLHNGNESDVDCGGTECVLCSVGQSCSVPTDCSSGVCDGNVCRTPSPTNAPTDTPTKAPSIAPTHKPCHDGVKNSDETDIDCGGGKFADTLEGGAWEGCKCV